MKSDLDPHRASFADAIGRMLADQVWAEITSGNPAAQAHEHAQADQTFARARNGAERAKATEARAITHT